MEQTPLVSITCMTYNHERYIAQAIESFLMQETTFPYEILIGEDCSKDKTRSIVEEYQKRYPDKITLITSAENVGARKNGIRLRHAAKGKYIAICEGDDYWTDKHKLQRQVDFLESNANVVLVFHDVRVVGEADNLFLTDMDTNKVEIWAPNKVFNLWIPPLTAVFRNKIKSYPNEYLKVFNGDAFLFGMLARYGQFAKISFIGAAYRKHAGGVYSTGSYFSNAIRSIETRRLMLKSSYFDEAQKKEIHKAITGKKIQAFRYSVKRLKIFPFFSILFS